MIRMNRILKRATVVTLLSLLVSCGGTTNNDQGVSFLATGFLRSDNGGAYTPSTGSVLPLFSDTSSSGFDGLISEIRMAMQNNLTKQFIRVVRIDCDYQVPGSFITVPSNSFPVSTVIVAAPAPQTTTTTLADGTVITSQSENTTSSAQLGFTLVSPDLYAFINNNKASFPELPFQMIATCSATGVTQAGDVLTTNSLNYYIQFVEEAEVGAGNGPGVGVGTGGTLVTSGSTSALIPNTNNLSTNSEDTATAIDQEVVTVNEDGSITTTTVSGISVTSTDSVN